MLYFFIIKQGFVDQHRHSSAFSFLKYWKYCSVCMCVCVHVLQPLCVSGCVFSKCMSILSVQPPFPTKEILEPQHPNKRKSHSDHQNFYRQSGQKQKHFSQSQVMLFVALVTLESNSLTIFRSFHSNYLQ